MPIILSSPAATAETLTLDPTSEDAGNAPVELVSASYRLREHSYPAPPLEVQYTGSIDTEGDLPSARKYRNRAITLRVICWTQAALEALQAKVEKVGREGGTLQRVLATGEAITFDLLSRETFEPTFDHLYHRDGWTEVGVMFAALPFGRGEPVQGGDQVETTLPALVWTEASIPGDVAALGELEIDNDAASANKMALIWGMEYRPSAQPLQEEAESKTMGSGVAAAVGAAESSGAGSNVARATDIGVADKLLLSGTFAGAGMYRMFARVYGTGTGTTYMRATWADPASTRTVTTGPTVSFSNNDVYKLLDLGLVQAETDGKWEIFGYSDVATADVDIDVLFWVPVEDGYGELAGTSVTPGIKVAAAGSPSVILTHESVTFRTTAGAWTGYAKPRAYEGSYLRVPPSGPEGHSVRFFVKFVHVGALPAESPGSSDAVIDPLSARLTVTPRYLVVPSA